MKPAELRAQIRDLQNDHIVRFIGICIEPHHQSIISEYCPKGSLQVGEHQLRSVYGTKYAS